MDLWRLDYRRIDESRRRGALWLQSQLKAGLPASTKEVQKAELLYVLRQTGVSGDDPDVVKLAQDSRDTTLATTRFAAVRAQACEQFHPKLLGDIAQCAQFLIDNQAHDGSWGTGRPVEPLPESMIPPPLPPPPPPGIPGGTVRVMRKTVLPRRTWGESGDVTNTVLALVGLSACGCAGLFPEESTFSQAEKWLTDSQNEDGGWGDGKGKTSTVLTTAMGVYGLCGCLQAQKQSPRKDVRIQKSIRWLDANVQLEPGPGRKNPANPLTIYWLNKAAAISQKWDWPALDCWNEDAVEWLLKKQNEDGSWGAGSDADKITDTCWAVMALPIPKRRSPVFIKREPK
jgi:prenyltransferase beta subunit